MNEEEKKTKLAKLNIASALVIVLIICVFAWTIVSAVNPIVVKDLSKTTAAKQFSGIDETYGAKGKVIAKYVDTNGNELCESTSIQGVVGEEYKLERKEINGYKAYGNEPVNKTGNYTVEDIQVVFVYQSETESLAIEQDDHNVTVQVQTEKESAEYSLKIITKDEDGGFVKGVKYKIQKENEVLRNGTVDGNTFVVGTITVNSEGKENFKITEDVGRYYEKPFDGDIEFSITKKWNESKGKYEIELSGSNNQKDVQIKISGSEIIVTVINTTHSISEFGAGDGIFDLDIKKYISSIVIDNGKNTKEITRTIDNKDSILKLEIPSNEISKTNVIITYTILVENVGEMPGFAREIVDYIPDNLQFIDNDEWEEVDGKIITTSLENILLMPGESKELLLDFRWNLENDNVGVRKNIVKITKTTGLLNPNNPNDPKSWFDINSPLNIEDFELLDDITPDNTAEAIMITTVKTGAEKSIRGTVLIVLIGIAGWILTEKRRIKNER